MSIGFVVKTYIKTFIIAYRTTFIILMVVVGFILFLYAGYLFSGELSYEIVNTPAILKDLKEISDLHVYRMVVSDRKIMRFNEHGEVSFNGGDYIDYVGVCTVDAVIPLDSVHIEQEKSGKVIITVSKININEGVKDEKASFTWKNNAKDNLGALSKVSNKVKKRAPIYAIQNGIVEKSKENATQFLKSFFKALGYGDIDVLFIEGKGNLIYVNNKPFGMHLLTDESKKQFLVDFNNLNQFYSRDVITIFSWGQLANSTDSEKLFLFIKLMYDKELKEILFENQIMCNDIEAILKESRDLILVENSKISIKSISLIGTTPIFGTLLVNEYQAQRMIENYINEIQQRIEKDLN